MRSVRPVWKNQVKRTPPASGRNSNPTHSGTTGSRYGAGSESSDRPLSKVGGLLQLFVVRAGVGTEVGQASAALAAPPSGSPSPAACLSSIPPLFISALAPPRNWGRPTPGSREREYAPKSIWTRDLRYHPHIHYLVPEGAISATGWVRPKNPDVLVPVKPLAVRMRNRFRAALKAANFKLYLTIPHDAWRHPWNADARQVGSGARAFEYLARYVQKTAIDSARIATITDQSVSIGFTDRETGQARTVVLSGAAFLHRFLQHVLPRGFVRVRHFGYLSAAACGSYQRVRALLRAGAVRLLLPDTPPHCCPVCGLEAMQFLGVIRHGRCRAPPTVA
jgi:Putative transposase